MVCNPPHSLSVSPLTLTQLIGQVTSAEVLSARTYAVRSETPKVAWCAFAVLRWFVRDFSSFGKCKAQRAFCVAMELLLSRLLCEGW